MVVPEEEPNDTPLTAQVVPFPRPGEKVVFRGRVARGDKGSRSEQLETFFSQFDIEVGDIHDWVVADPDALGAAAPGDGPIPLRITADWRPATSGQQAQQAIDLDFWIGMLVDDRTFFVDGFKAMSDVQMATDQRPESWPRRDQPHYAIVLYLQPKGVRIRDGEPLPNDGFARKLVIGIQHYAGSAAEYTVTIENLASLGTGQASFTGLESHQVDDGLLSAQFFAGPSGGIILNRFRPSRYPARLVAISHPFFRFRDLPDPSGKSIRVLVLAGESDRFDAAPPPLNQATVLFDKMLPIPRTIEMIGEVIDLPIDPPVTIESGVVYVGLQFPSDPIEQTGIALAFDRSPAQFLRTYFSADNGQTWGRPRRDEPFTGLPVFMNANIRATFAFGKTVSSQIVRESSLRKRLGGDRSLASLKPLRIERSGEVKAGEIVSQH
ncbi:MAG: hypothetical protein N0A16_07875 [Blastocatellia bacterium]|nr:hypothetical protein [Blastocatellia bacterium]MCS7157632.1 hypothetical protein [Blastocatellia bacterium]MCX7751897.1 hypothetical protein [Blastocatellia bacterium]MDW8257107.1 hypothetical protein [Acidobacteriota bacterium]